ncbi:MAG TPA: hypothetical protein VIL09_15765 [Microvirga sp.]|jgi:hypothetical protein
MTPPADPTTWRGFSGRIALTALGLAGLLYAFVLVADPYGVRAAPGRDPRPLMDLNQRYMYPQVVRSGRFDGAVFGTSTIRLLDPLKLGEAFGARFANLGLNAGTPWEQMQLADLYLRHVPAPKALVFGLDRTWCEEDAGEKRLTPRPFPPWLYDESRLNDLPELLDFKSLEIAGRLALHELGFMPERIRGDGYEVFVPDEALYDPARARFHIYEQEPQAAAPRARLRRAERAALRLPALDWLGAVLDRVPASTSVTLALMPIHVAWQAQPGSREAAVERECKARIAALARKHGAAAVDFRIRSAVTTEDTNYWDPLHYRIGIADRVVAALAEARATGRDAADGFYRVLAPAQR